MAQRKRALGQQPGNQDVFDFLNASGDERKEKKRKQAIHMN
jgi:hypothetical protein